MLSSVGPQKGGEPFLTVLKSKQGIGLILTSVLCRVRPAWSVRLNLWMTYACSIKHPRTPQQEGQEGDQEDRGQGARRTGDEGTTSDQGSRTSGALDPPGEDQGTKLCLPLCPYLLAMASNLIAFLLLVANIATSSDARSP